MNLNLKTGFIGSLKSQPWFRQLCWVVLPSAARTIRGSQPSDDCRPLAAPRALRRLAARPRVAARADPRHRGEAGQDTARARPIIRCRKPGSRECRDAHDDGRPRVVRMVRLGHTRDPTRLLGFGSPRGLLASYCFGSTRRRSLSDGADHRCTRDRGIASRVFLVAG